MDYDAVEQKKRSLYLSESYQPRVDFPYAIGSHLWASPQGINVEIWSNSTLMAHLARKAVYTTLEGNGIPSDLLEWFPVCRIIKNGRFLNSNPLLQIDHTCVGDLFLVTFPFIKNYHEIHENEHPLDWFTSPEKGLFTRLSILL